MLWQQMSLDSKDGFIATSILMKLQIAGPTFDLLGILRFDSTQQHSIHIELLDCGL